MNLFDYIADAVALTTKAKSMDSIEYIVCLKLLVVNEAKENACQHWICTKLKIYLFHPLSVSI